MGDGSPGRPLHMAQAFVTVPALVDFTWEGRRYRRGELLTVSPVTAAVLARKRQVSLTLWHEIPVPKGRRRYRRRDMVASA